MPNRPPLSLTHRIVNSQLAFGLACVLVAAMVAIQMTLWQSVDRLLAVAVAIPLGLLLIGSFVMRNHVRVPGSIDTQLRELADSGWSEGRAVLRRYLRPLKEAGPVAAGWNQLIDELERHDAGESLERRICDAIGDVGAGRWQTAFESLSEGMAITTESGLIENYNGAFSAMLRLDAEATLPSDDIHALLAAFGPEETNRAVLETLSQSTCKRNGELRRGDEMRDGVLRVTRVPLLSRQTECGIAACDGLVWMLRDVTQQRLSEEMRNQFVFTATHELRTPLANIKAYAETLATADGIDLEKQKGFYNIINSEATRLARFIDELLDVSQMETGAISVLKHEIDIERLLNEVIESVQPQMKQKKLLFDRVFPAKLPRMPADKDKLAATLINLLGNAVKYTPPGGEVRLIVESEATLLHIHVEDTGIGIRAEDLSRVGEKFFRSEDERIRDIPGSGLGVAFAAEVARLHHGKLSIQSEWNHGSRFTLTLPISAESK